MTGSSAENDEEDGLVHGYYDIPLEEELEKMSFVQIASLLASCDKGSPKFIVVDRVLKKHFAKDQAKINRFNIGFGACIGGIFGLAGVFLGAYLKISPPEQQVVPAASAYQQGGSDVASKSQVAPIAPGASSAATPKKPAH